MCAVRFRVVVPACTTVFAAGRRCGRRACFPATEANRAGAVPNAVEYSPVSNDSANRLYVLPISIVATLGEFLFGVDGGGMTIGNVHGCQSRQ